jgi:hypothetical protein
MKWNLFLAGLAIGAALSTLAFVLDCRACVRGVPIALIGTAGYLALLALALWRGPGRWVYVGAFLAFGAHAFLVLRMLQGTWCWICAAAAANSAALAGLALSLDRANWRRAGVALPWSAAILLLLPRPADSLVQAVRATDADDAVRVVVLEKADCPYCLVLREEVIPQLRREFGDRIVVRFRDAGEFPGVSRTPTVIVTRRRDGRVIEGLPPYEMLRDAVRDALGGRP